MPRHWRSGGKEMRAWCFAKKKQGGDVVAYDNVFVCAKPRGTWNSRACVNDGFAVCGK